MAVADLVASRSEPRPCWICGQPSVLLGAYAPMSLFRCPECDFCFQPAIDPEQIRAAYDVGYFQRYGDNRSYDFSVGQRRHEARVRLRLIRKFVPRTGRLLEIGSATGFFLLEAETAGWQSVGIEPCEPVAREAVERFGTETITGFVEDLELGSGKFDVVCGWHVLEHIPNPVPALEKLRTALRPAGHAFFEVPNFGCIRSRQSGPRWPYLDPAHHVGQFSPRSIRALFTRAGFHVQLVTSTPMFSYYRRQEVLRPRHLVRRGRYAVATRSGGFGCHPHKFDLLRIVAQVPAGPASSR